MEYFLWAGEGIRGEGRTFCSGNRCWRRPTIWLTLSALLRGWAGSASRRTFSSMSRNRRKSSSEAPSLAAASARPNADFQARERPLTQELEGGPPQGQTENTTRITGLGCLRLYRSHPRRTLGPKQLPGLSGKAWGRWLKEAGRPLLRSFPGRGEIAGSSCGDECVEWGILPPIPTAQSRKSPGQSLPSPLCVADPSSSRT
mmetsp:Transcript_14219/g.19758  ORF Transcript_14219/g.19758 Transcript_14219/m.19758 type:complete len:201 (+) Transcript_14219:2706-3308(+)